MSLPRTLCPLIIAAVLGAAVASPVPAQDNNTAPPNPPAKEDAPKDDALTPIQNVAETIAKQNAAIKAKERELAAAKTDAEKAAAQAEIDALKAELAEQRAQFERLAGGADISILSSNGESQPIDLKEELDLILRPMVDEFREATARPREIEGLRNDLERAKKKHEALTKAILKLDSLIAKAEDPNVVKALKDLREQWREMHERAANDITAIEFELAEKLRTSEGALTAIGGIVRRFLENRGRNLLFAALAGLGVFLLMRYIHRRLHLRFFKPRRQKSFALRIADVTYYGLTFAASAAAVLIVLYTSADWLLFGFAIIVLAGFAWTAKQTLPRIYEQAKLMLDLGAVREGERVMFHGLPFRVEAVNYYSYLVNPSLQGGRIRLPLADLRGLNSRSVDDSIPWFPSERGDWVELSDGTFGRVEIQTPEVVKLRLLSGAFQSIPTDAYLGLSPTNLRDGFGIRVDFGIGYDHQKEFAEVPAILEAKIRAGLIPLVTEDHILALGVDFAEAAASSLNFAVLARFSQEVAPQRPALPRAIQRLCVEAANEHGWEIPFQQVTVHQKPA
ncbi:MAG: hypothetical protein R3F11_02155 [Verrucomicrobiales bacterium]